MKRVDKIVCTITLFAGWFLIVISKQTMIGCTFMIMGAMMQCAGMIVEAIKETK